MLHLAIRLNASHIVQLNLSLHLVIVGSAAPAAAAAARTQHPAWHHFTDNVHQATVTNYGTIRLRLDGRSTAYQRSVRSQWRNTGRWPASRSHFDLFIQNSVQQQPTHSHNAGHRMVVARSNCSRIAVESKSNRSCNHRIIQLRQLTELSTNEASSSLGQVVTSAHGTM